MIYIFQYFFEYFSKCSYFKISYSSLENILARTSSNYGIWKSINILCSFSKKNYFK